MIWIVVKILLLVMILKIIIKTEIVACQQLSQFFWQTYSFSSFLHLPQLRMHSRYLSLLRPLYIKICLFRDHVPVHFTVCSEIHLVNDIGLHYYKTNWNKLRTLVRKSLSASLLLSYHSTHWWPYSRLH